MREDLSVEARAWEKLIEIWEDDVPSSASNDGFLALKAVTSLNARHDGG